MSIVLNNSIHLKGIEDYSKIGNSRLGGRPDLPIQMEYPIFDNGFYEFILQINLSHCKIEGLPTSGLFSIFYGNLDKSEAIGYHFKDNEQLETKEVPTHMKFAGVTNFCEHISHQIEIRENKLRPRVEFPEYNDSNFNEEDNEMHWKNDFLNSNSFLMNNGLQEKNHIYLKSNGFDELLYGGGISIDSDKRKIRYSGRNAARDYLNINDLKSCEMTLSRFSNDEESQLWINQLDLFEEQKEFHLNQFMEYKCILSLASHSEARMVWGDLHKLEFYGLESDFCEKRNINLDSTIP